MGVAPAGRGAGGPRSWGRGDAGPLCPLLPAEAVWNPGRINMKLRTPSGEGQWGGPHPTLVSRRATGYLWFQSTQQVT